MTNSHNQYYHEREFQNKFVNWNMNFTPVLMAFINKTNIQ